MPSDLVIVYHRQPYEEVEENGKTVLRENKSPNGIVPTLKSFFGKVDHGAWVAWKLADDSNEPGWDRQIEVDDSFGSYSVSRLPLTQKQVHEFYHVTSKEAFWPILHSFKDRYNYDPVDWPNFREVNWRFAEAAAAEAADGALVWVHDYNLWLVPGYLRQMRPDVKIAFFHHTPFPAPDMFNVLPWRKEIIESLMACDSVGFHIPRYATNFAAVVQSLMDVEVTDRANVPDDLIAEGTALTERRVPTILNGPFGDVNLSVAPVGVDVEYIQARAREEATQQRVKALRTDLGDRKLILSVGRTDYTKGGIEQLESFERVLEERPELRGQVQLMHVSVSANRDMAAYGEIQSAIEEAAGRINGRFGSLDWQPITLVSRAIPFKRSHCLLPSRIGCVDHTFGRRHEPRRQGIHCLPCRWRRGVGSFRVRWRGRRTGCSGCHQPVLGAIHGRRNRSGIGHVRNRTSGSHEGDANRCTPIRSVQLGQVH